MKMAFATTFDGNDVRNWSGTPFYMSHAFQQRGFTIDYLGNFKRELPFGFKAKQIFKKIMCDQRESPRFNIVTAKNYSKQLEEKLKSSSADIILAPQIHPICYLETNKPLILWTDALYASLIGFYPGFSSHSASSIAQGNTITRECLNRCSLAIFSSDWAARTAIEIYGVDKNKIKVVPFGANIDHAPTLDETCEFIRARSKSKIKLLFLGKHWDRKGGQVVFDVTKALDQAGHDVELNFVGCHPPADIEIPSYIHVHGFISKRTPEGIEKIKKLLRESHFLFVPSRAEAYGIVFCEANAYGLPCLTTHVGGISTIVKDNVNGMTFALDASPESYCEFIVNAMKRYEEFAITSFHEFEKRLNWKVATESVKKMIAQV